MKFNRQDKSSIQTLFNQIAKKYDLINDLMSFGLQKHIKKSAVKNSIKKLGKIPEDVLDICCGTGDIAILFQKLCPNTNIVGIDFSEEMLKIAKEKAPNINFIQGDTSTKERINGVYDICFISFGLRNLPDIDEFLENVKNYLKKDGIIAILDLGKPNQIMQAYFYLHYNIFIPIIAKLFHRNIEPYKYLTESAKTYPSQKEILQKLKQHGFIEGKNKNFYFGIIATQTAKYSQIGE